MSRRIELQPIDPQTNGPQLFYGLRYHTFITKPDQVKTYHEQVGYWLWEPATRRHHPHAGRFRAARPRWPMARRAPTPRSSSSWPREAPRHSASARIRSSSTRSDRRVPHQGDDQRRWHLVVRRRHGADDPRPSGTLPSHRPQHAQQDRRGHAQPAGTCRLTRQQQRTHSMSSMWRGQLDSEQGRQRAVSQRAAAGLAARAVVGLVVGVHDALHRRAAHRARLAVACRARPSRGGTPSPCRASHAARGFGAQALGPLGEHSRAAPCRRATSSGVELRASA